MQNPMTNKLKNPLGKQDKTKLKKYHDGNMAKCGVKAPKSPLA